MKVILGSPKGHYMVRAAIFLITAALVWAMTGCTEVYPTEYELTISSTAGGNVTVPGEGSFTCGKGVSVWLSAAPDKGCRFVKWEGNVTTIGNVTNAQTVVRVTGEYSITAKFEEIPKYHLTVNSTAGGSVHTPGQGTFTYNDGTVVNLVATPAGPYAFVNWTGDVSSIADVNAATTTINMSGNYSIRANFEGEAAVNITDRNLEAAIRKATGKQTGFLYPSNLKPLIWLDAGAKNVSNLAGLEYCTRLTKLYLYDNQIRDISPLANLTSLRELYLSVNQIDDISPLTSLTNLTYLDLSGNGIDDISPLANLTSLTELYLSGNQITDISPLASLTGLSDLSLGDNQVHNISSLTNLTNLTLLNLSNNPISNIEPLVRNPGLLRGDKVYLYDTLIYSPLSYSDVSTYIDQLQARGVIVEYVKPRS
jgi:hypothetical protein